MSMARLKAYIDAYGLKREGAVEKSDLIDIIINARVRTTPSHSFNPP
jgi:hypothetical protein